MSRRLADELGAILDACDVMRRADEQRQKQLESDGLAFLAGFAELRAKVVRPVFEAAGEMLKAHGHDFAIEEHEFVFEADPPLMRMFCGWRMLCVRGLCASGSPPARAYSARSFAMARVGTSGPMYSSQWTSLRNRHHFDVP